VDTIPKHDVSDYIVRLTRVPEHASLDPFETLLKILKDKALLGGTGYIMEKRTAICFTESTLVALDKVFRSDQAQFRYKPFGIMIAKFLAFGWDALPVIYQPKADYELLHESKKHLHVTYQLNSSDNADFTWEREWRMARYKLELDPLLVHVLVPSQEMKTAVEARLSPQENPPERPWRFIVLDELITAAASY